MSLLLTRDALLARRAVAQGPLAGLAAGLRRELDPLLHSEIAVPTEKALLSRAGGRCDRDGTYLAYDPFDARHRCPICGRELGGELHDRFRLYWHQLWLAERTLHAALLGVLLDDAAASGLAVRLLDAYATQYLHYPNSDNVLGPSRPFFSTYLESIWLLQLTIALDLLESGAPSDDLRAVGGRVRAELIAPSAALIASFDEGMSNRQVWNNAALLAAGRMLDQRAMIERAVVGPSGLVAHLDTSLFADGTWYEGENYHFFAHRGLWYGLQMAEQAGVAVPPALVSRFRDGFSAPFRSLLPDLTYPSRRDSRYAVSVRQPRFAESCELGLAQMDDPRLTSMLARLYDPSIPHSATGRASSSADVERDLAATGLTRADLSWRTLLHARPELPPLVATPFASDLLPAQGFAILRRDAGSVYVALDYGHSGGGHGHPDRLNLLLSDGDARWFDDPGTGSYVDPSLHWYRSTLAHSAPMIDGHSQERVDGRLLAFDEIDGGGWMSATAELLPGLDVSRSITVLEDYLVDVLEWESADEHQVALPFHGVIAVSAAGIPLLTAAKPMGGGEGLEDGVDFLSETARVSAPDEGVLRLLGDRGSQRLDGWVATQPSTIWWAARAPDVPTRPGTQPMVLASRNAARGRFVSVWSWRDAISGVEVQGNEVVVRRREGSRDTHSAVANGWQVMRTRAGDAPAEALQLGGLVRDGSREGRRDRSAPPPREPSHRPKRLPYAAMLGERHYRRSEQSWHDAGEPRAAVNIKMERSRALHIDVDVGPSFRIFAPPGAENPLDNEPAGINGDGVQLYVRCGNRSGAWLLVPRIDSRDVTVQRISGWDESLDVSAHWRPTEAGWALSAQISLPRDAAEVALDVIVNEIVPGRARRRGQLVLSGAHEEFIYLRGDRQDPGRLIHFTIADA